MTGERKPSIAVVVLNWNGAGDTIECLRSLKDSATPIHTIVVDNGSTDASVQQITASGLADVVVENDSNLGYAEGNNVGLRLAISERFSIVAVLNNDTVACRDSFAVLARHLPESEHRAVSPDIRYFDDPRRSWFAGGIVDHGWPRHLQAHEFGPGNGALRPTETLSGCCIAARGATWRHVGLFDPRFFLIFEDSDWSMRARRRGVSLFVVTQSRIRHKVSRSFAEGPASLLGNFYFLRNGLWFEARHARRHLLRFVVQWLLRPTIGTVVRRTSWTPIAFRWLGAFAAATGCAGSAWPPVERLAARLARPPL